MAARADEAQVLAEGALTFFEEMVESLLIGMLPHPSAPRSLECAGPVLESAVVYCSRPHS